MNLTLYTNLTNYKQLFFHRIYFSENTVLQNNKNTTVVHFEFVCKILQIAPKMITTILILARILLKAI